MREKRSIQSEGLKSNVEVNLSLRLLTCLGKNQGNLCRMQGQFFAEMSYCLAAGTKVQESG